MLDKANLIPYPPLPQLFPSCPRLKFHAEPIHEEGGYGGNTAGGYGGVDEFGGAPQGTAVEQQRQSEGNGTTISGSKKEEWASRLTTLDMDVREEDAIAHAAKQVKERFGSNEVRLVVNVSGMVSTPTL